MRLTKSEIQYLRSLSQKKYRVHEKKFLLEGWRPLEEALKSDWRIELIAALPSQNTEHRALLEKAKKKAIHVKELSEKELGQVSSTVHSQGVVAVVRQREYRIEEVLSKQANSIVALDAVNDPGNLGSIIRSCDWFGVDALLLGEGCVELYNEKVVRSTAGSIFHIPAIEEVELPVALSKARKSGY
ncbi:MAG TPA: RNA methyltransferase, partial [Bacteroidota bacterium]